MLTCRVLGPIEISADGRAVEVRGTIQRTLLGALLVGGGRQVMTNSLMEELWGSRPPGNAENALQAHVSRLRRRFEEVEPERTTPRLVSLSSGYRLLSDGAQVDADMFVRAINEVRGRPDMEPVEVIARIREALGLWRGPVFGGALGGLICQAATVRFEEQRSSAYSILFENELLIGRHAQIIAELAELVEAESLNERLCQQLMVALYGAGRQTDALALYRRMRERLTEELGIEPSPALRRVELAILSQDPILDAPMARRA
jgi:SARP family transcriptional regulator, regulator of embCAB operon